MTYVLGSLSYAGLGDTQALTRAATLKNFKTGAISEEAYRAWEAALKKYDQEHSAWEKARNAVKELVRPNVEKSLQPLMDAAKKQGGALGAQAVREVQKQINAEIEKEIKKRFLTPEPSFPTPPMAGGIAPGAGDRAEKASTGDGDNTLFYVAGAAALALVAFGATRRKS